jgi:hypothetical protein
MARCGQIATDLEIQGHSAQPPYPSNKRAGILLGLELDFEAE